MRILIAMLAAAAAGLPGEAALAVLPPQTGAGLEASGYVDIDGDGPSVPYSDLIETEVGSPLARPIVRALDAPGFVYYYDSVADMASGALKLTALIGNANRHDGLQAQGGSLMNVSARAWDVLTFQSASASSFTVTLRLGVTGTLVAATSIPGATTNAVGLARLSASSGSAETVATRALLPGGNNVLTAVNEQLSVSRTLTGPVADLSFESYLNFMVTEVGPDGGAEAHLGNSALLEVFVPRGVSLIASTSQAFGAPVVVVPEPGSLALMLVGLCMLGPAAARHHGRDRSAAAPIDLSA